MVFGQKKLGAIGLDISDQSIELAQVRAAELGKVAAVNGYGRIELDGGIIKDGRLQKPPEFKEAVRALLSKPKQGGFDGKLVVLSLPEHQCYHHVFPINTIGDGRGLYHVVEEALSAALPFDLSTMFWDWTIVRQDGSSLVVYAVSAPKDVVAAYQNALEGIGVTIRAVEPQVYSAARALWPKPILESPALLIDIGSRETAIATLDDFGIHQSSVVASGSLLMREAIMSSLKTDANTAEKVLRTIGLRQLKHPNISTIHDAVKKFLRPVLEDAQQHVAFYHSQRHINPGTLSQIFFTGGGSLIPGVSEVLAGALKMTIQSSQASRQYDPVFAPEDFVLYANALGAARRPALDDGDEPINVLVTRREQTTALKSWIPSWLSRKGRT